MTLGTQRRLADRRMNKHGKAWLAVSGALLMVCAIASCADPVSSARQAGGSGPAQASTVLPSASISASQIDSPSPTSTAASIDAAARFTQFVIANSTSTLAAQGAHLSVVSATNEAVYALLGDASPRPGTGAQVVTLFVAVGDFVGRDAKVPPGAALPTGNTLYQIVEQPGQAIDGWGLLKTGLDISTLGDVTDLPAPIVLSPVTGSATPN